MYTQSKDIKLKYHKKHKKENQMDFSLVPKRQDLVDILLLLSRNMLKVYKKLNKTLKHKWDYLLDSSSNSLRKSKELGKDLSKY